MPRSGTLVICVQNLDFSGANQVVLNIVSGKVHESNVVVLSPKLGAFAARFVDSGAAVRVGNLENLLNEIRDVFCIICNTIMTAPIVVEMANKFHPVIWILHEWWDDEMIIENLNIRNYQGFSLLTVKHALAKASKVVFVCESQKKLYNPVAPSAVIFVGVPDPQPRQKLNLVGTSSIAITNNNFELDPKISLAHSPDFDGVCEDSVNRSVAPFVFLCLGIICPRKNQLWTIQLFKMFAENKSDVRLQVVGARYTRAYEIEYLELVKKEIGGDLRIELYDVTDNVDPFYRNAHCVILTSLNEVTPMVISESLSWGLPVLSTNIAGISEMYIDGQEGYLFAPGDTKKALQSMEMIYSNQQLRSRMAADARLRFETVFDLDLMVDSYRQVMIQVAPPVILLDMDGALVDWDKGFYSEWAARCPIDRTSSYYMEDCITNSFFRKEALEVYRRKGFFENLEPMEGAIQAVREMEQEGLQLFICSSPVKHSKYCAQEKLNWIGKHLGEEWLDRVILCQDKTTIAGDILIDDKPMDLLCPFGKHTAATWKQVLFDAPYNRTVSNPRLVHWADWREVVLPLLGKAIQRDTMKQTDGFHQEDVTVLGNAGTLGMKLPEPLPSDTVSSIVVKKTVRKPPLGTLFNSKVSISDASANSAVTAGRCDKICKPVGSGFSTKLKLHRDSSASSDQSSCTQSSYCSFQSGMSAVDIQRNIDMLQSSKEPLSPEDFATILSGSLSLMSNDDDNGGDPIFVDRSGGSYIAHHHHKMGHDQKFNSDTATTTITYNSNRLISNSDFSSNGHDITGTNVTNNSAATIIAAGDDMQKQQQQLIAVASARTEHIKTLQLSAEHRIQKHRADVDNHHRQLALQTDDVDAEGLQVFRNSYHHWREGKGQQGNRRNSSSNNSASKAD